jgi:predicted amidophosphoribosyltransferase
MLRLARSIGEEIDVPVVAALSRQKRRSARKSVLEVRGRIVDEEYRVTSDAAAVTNRHVILFDDMVTTGQTLAGAARLLANAGAEMIRPVVLDRTVSERVLQRVPGRAPENCRHAA